MTRKLANARGKRRRDETNLPRKKRWCRLESDSVERGGVSCFVTVQERYALQMIRLVSVLRTPTALPMPLVTQSPRD